MINVNDEIKQAYDKSTTQIDKILVNGNEYRISNVEYYDDVYNEGNIFGTAISRCLEFEIQNTIDLEKTEIEYFTGILINTTIQWISLGKFIIQSVEPNDTTQINKVTAMDYMIKSNTIYTSNLDYSSGKITLLQVLQEACNNSNLELATFDFANKDFIVDSNQFDEGTLNRQVIQAIAQLSGTVAKIRTDNKLYLINPNNDLEVSKIFNLNNYKEAEIKRNTHPLNVVSLGMADVEGENITLRDEESVIKNGENILVINDNPFAYTQAKREQLITALFDVVKGFEYTSYYFECQGLPYLETLDKIQFKDKKGNIYNSYIFRFNYKSPNGLESSIEAPSITKATVNYQNVPSALDIAKRAELKVDKANQTITFIVEEQTTQSNRITNVEKETNTVASNLNTFINETYSNDISNLQDQIDGAIQFWNGEAIPTLSNYPANEWTTEEQRNNHRADIYTVIQDVDGEMKQGKSYRFDKVGTTWQWVELTDNELSAVQALASSKAKVYVTTPTVPYNVGDLWLKDEELYECITAKDATGSYSASDWVKATKYTDDTKANEVADGLAQTNTKVSTIEQNLDGITERVEATETGIQENTQSINQLENEILLTDTFERQKDFQIDAAENILTDVKVYGELEQDTKVSSNILKSFSAGETDYFSSLSNVYISNTNYYKAEPLANSWIHVECDRTDGINIGYINHFIPSNKIPKLKPNTTYTIIYEFRNVDITKMSTSLATLRTQGTTVDNYFSGIQFISGTYMQNYNNKMYKITKATLSEFSGNIALTNFHTVNAGDKFSYDYRISVLEGNKLSQDYTYEEYANRPSPEEEARINTAGDVLNLFDNSVGGNAGEYLNVNGEVATGNANLRYTDYIKLPFDITNLAISGMENTMSAPAICFYDKDRNFISGIKYDSALTKIIDVPNKAYFFRTSYRTINTKFQIEKGIIIHDYIPPNTRGILYENIGKNYFDFSKTTLLYSTATLVTKEKNTLQIKGTANTYIYYRVKLKVKAGTYTFQRKWKVISGDNTNGMTGAVIINQGYNGTQLMNLGKGANSKNFTVTEDCELDIIFYISGNVALTSETEIQFYDIQLEKGTKATDVEVHKQNNAVITLPENEFMGKIGTYEDYIEGNILHKRIGKLVLDGTKNWVINSSYMSTAKNTTAFQTTINGAKLLNKGNLIGYVCNKFPSYNAATWHYDEPHIVQMNDTITFLFGVPNSIASTVANWKSWLAEQYANGTPVEIYYVLAEEYTRQIDKYTLPTMKGINNISVSAPLSATYYTNVDINSALTSKAEYAEQVIKADEISTRVSSTETTIANQSADISNINDNIGSLNNSVSANQKEITVIKEDYTDLKQTVDGFDFTVVDRIQQQIANGEITSNVVKTTTVAIDADGIKVAKSGSEMQSLLDNEGFYVNKGNIDKTETKNNILTVDKDGVVTENLYVRTYLTAGYHRTEGYIENGKKRTGVFYQGGVDD